MSKTSTTTKKISLPPPPLQADIRKAYLHLAVRLHPDKNPGDDQAKSKFQSLQRIYAVLSDEAKRASYDRTGSLDAAEGLGGESFDELYAYFRDAFKEVTPTDLDDYELRFRGSEEERRELLELYERFRGNMDKVFEWLVCSDPSRDAHRFAATVRSAAERGELPGGGGSGGGSDGGEGNGGAKMAQKLYPAFERWAKAKVDGKPPPAEDPLKPRPRAAEMEREASKKKNNNSVSSLALQIRAAGEDRLAGVIASIEARAAAGKGGKKKKGAGAAEAKAAATATTANNNKKKSKAPPTDEEFQAAAARLEARRKANAEKKGKA